MERERRAQEHEWEDEVDFLDQQMEIKISQFIQETISLVKMSIMCALAFQVLESTYTYAIDPAPHGFQKVQKHLGAIGK